MIVKGQDAEFGTRASRRVCRVGGMNAVAGLPLLALVGLDYNRRHGRNVTYNISTFSRVGFHHLTGLSGLCDKIHSLHVYAKWPGNCLWHGVVAK